MKITENPFAGSWSGKWEGRTYNGSWKLDISETGQVQGTAYTSKKSGSYLVSGKVSPEGKMIHTHLTFEGTASVELQDTETLHVKWRDTLDRQIADYGESTLKRVVLVK